VQRVRDGVRDARLPARVELAQRLRLACRRSTPGELVQAAELADDRRQRVETIVWSSEASSIASSRPANVSTKRTGGASGALSVRAVGWTAVRLGGVTGTAKGG
jgi:hypothetical protein